MLNSVPSYIMSINTLSCFKSRLDKYWSNQDIIYNFCAESQEKVK